MWALYNRLIKRRVYIILVSQRTSCTTRPFAFPRVIRLYVCCEVTVSNSYCHAKYITLVALCREPDAYNSPESSKAYMRKWIKPILAQMISCPVYQCWFFVDQLLKNIFQWVFIWNSNFSLRKILLKFTSGKCRPYGMGFNLLSGQFCNWRTAVGMASIRSPSNNS